MPDWPAFVREFGLPIAILFIFVGAIVTGLLVAGKSVEAERAAATNALKEERAQAAERLNDWKQRWADEHALRQAGEQRLDQILPALANVTSLVAIVRDELIRGNQPRTRR